MCGRRGDGGGTGTAMRLPSRSLEKPSRARSAGSDAPFFWPVRAPCPAPALPAATPDWPRLGSLLAAGRGSGCNGARPPAPCPNDSSLLWENTMRGRAPFTRAVPAPLASSRLRLAPSPPPTPAPGKRDGWRCRLMWVEGGRGRAAGGARPGRGRAGMHRESNRKKRARSLARSTQPLAPSPALPVPHTVKTAISEKALELEGWKELLKNKTWEVSKPNITVRGEGGERERRGPQGRASRRRRARASGRRPPGNPGRPHTLTTHFSHPSPLSLSLSLLTPSCRSPRSWSSPT